MPFRLQPAVDYAFFSHLHHMWVDSFLAARLAEANARGRYIFGNPLHLVHRNARLGCGDRSQGRRFMNLMYVFSGLLAVLLFVYLLYALIMAERF
jgi:K+-transporting ATPase KdpF subunit